MVKSYLILVVYFVNVLGLPGSLESLVAYGLDIQSQTSECFSDRLQRAYMNCIKKVRVDISRFMRNPVIGVSDHL